MLPTTNYHSRLQIEKPLWSPRFMQTYFSASGVNFHVLLFLTILTRVDYIRFQGNPKEY